MVIVLFVTLTTNCAWLKNEKSETAQAKDLYLRAKSALQGGRYTDALEKYKQLEETYPFSPYAQSAAIEQAYTHYKNHQYEEAIAILDHFIRHNPNYPHLDYVYHLKGIAYYNFSQGPFSWILKRDRTSKDPTPMIEAFNAFKQLQQTYPDSRYSADARLRTVALRNMLAVHEIRIADYYMRRGAYLAVINRCKYILEHYPNAQHTPEALVLLAEAYRRTASADLAQDTLEVLAMNYPDFAEQASRPARVSEEDRRNWVENLKDLSDTILERLRFKARY